MRWTSCPFGDVCKVEVEHGRPCDHDQYGDRIDACERNRERGEDMFVPLSEVIRRVESSPFFGSSTKDEIELLLRDHFLGSTGE